MTRRVVAITLLLVLVLLGLTAGVFAETIQRSLTLPDTQGMFPDGAGQTPTVTVKATATTTATPTVGANVLASDTFQRQDQSLWGTASDGNAWTGDANVATSFSVQGMVGVISDGNGALNALLGPAKRNVDLLIYGSMNHFTGTNNFGSVLRWIDVNNWYKAYIDGNTLVIMEQVDGVKRSLVSVAFAAQDGVSYALRFRAYGTTLMARAWEANTAEPANWSATVNDSSLSKGQSGVRVIMEQGSVVKINTFLATSANGR